MALTARCVRHAESEANAGRPTSDPASIALTALGIAQADSIAAAISHAPDVIVASPYLRARQTAEPLAHRYSLAIETWPIQEFTYLSPAQCVNTTAEQRRSRVQAYWGRNDVNCVDGDGAESFAAFAGRVDNTIARVSDLAARGVGEVILFGHGQFFQLMRMALESGQQAHAISMRRFRELDTLDPISNGSGFIAEVDRSGVRIANLR